MKTSNKLIFILALAFLFSLTSLMVYAKSNLVSWDESISDSPAETREFLSDFSTNILRLDSDYNFYLDDKSSGVRIDAPEELIGYLRVADEESLIFYREGPTDIPFAKIDVYIGVEGKDDLEIIAGNNARVRDMGQLELNNLKLILDNNAKLNLNISTEQLNLNAEDNVRLNLDGFAKHTNLRCEGNASINARDFNSDILIVDLSGNSKADFDQAKIISGSVNGNASLTAEGEDEGLTLSGNGSMNLR